MKEDFSMSCSLVLDSSQKDVASLALDLTKRALTSLEMANEATLPYMLKTVSTNATSTC